MDCILAGGRRNISRRRTALHQLTCWLALALVACQLYGCSLFVMAGKMLYGDPMLPSDFKQITKVDLTKDKKTVLILCATPMYLKDEVSSLEFDLIDGVSRRLKRHDISVVNPDKVLEWIDDNGGQWQDPRDLVDSFDTDYIISIKVNEFGYREQNSPSLFRGRASAIITAYQVQKVGEHKDAFEVFSRELTSIFPQHFAVSVHETTPNSFRKRYIDRLCDELALFFYDHGPLDDI